MVYELKRFDKIVNNLRRSIGTFIILIRFVFFCSIPSFFYFVLVSFQLIIFSCSYPSFASFSLSIKVNTFCFLQVVIH